ncbi:MAG: metallophosphoesterase, partial [Rhodospirillales bacterium]
PELVGSLKGTLASLERAADGLEGAVADDWPAIAEDLNADRPERARLVFLGDYLDRGPDSFAVIEWLCAGPPARLFPLPVEMVCLKGNHEAMMLDFLDGGPLGPVWLINGGRETLESYWEFEGLDYDDREPEETLRRSLAAFLPGEHMSFLRSLATSHRVGDYYFVHAGVRPDLALADQREQDQIWIRKPFLEWSNPFEAHVVHGHTVRAAVDWQPNRTGIDTGAWRSGCLTALVLEGRNRRLIQTA